MTDIWDKEKRSKVMSKIGSVNTRPEKILRSALHNMGIRFRIHRKDLPGKPDIVLPRHKVIIFVNGCFWHYHRDCPEGRIPATNSEYWKEKLQKNVTKDLRNIKACKELGWKVLVVWECEVERKLNEVLMKVQKLIQV